MGIIVRCNYNVRWNVCVKFLGLLYYFYFLRLFRVLSCIYFGKIVFRFSSPVFVICATTFSIILYFVNFSYLSIYRFNLFYSPLSFHSFPFYFLSLSLLFAFPFYLNNLYFIWAFFSRLLCNCECWSDRGGGWWVRCSGCYPHKQTSPLCNRGAADEAQ